MLNKIQFLIILFTGQITGQLLDIFDYSENFTDYTNVDDSESQSSVVNEEKFRTVDAYAVVGVDENIDFIKAQLLDLEDRPELLRSGIKEVIRVNLILEAPADFPLELIEIIRKNIETALQTALEADLSDKYQFEVRVNDDFACPTWWKLSEKGDVCVPTQYYYKTICTATNGGIFLDDRILNASGFNWQVRLNDGRCTETSGATTEEGVISTNIVGNTVTGNKYFFPYDLCNTELRDNSTTLEFINYVDLYTDKIDGIWAQADFRIYMTCHMDKDYTLVSEMEVGAADIQVEGQSALGDTDSSFAIELYEGESFTSKRTLKQFVIMDNIFFQISSTLPSFNSRMKFYINTCGLKQGNNQFDFLSSVS